MFWNTSRNKIIELENKYEELKHINHILEYGYRDIINGLTVKIDDLKKENNKLKKENKKLKKKLKK